MLSCGIPAFGTPLRPTPRVGVAGLSRQHLHAGGSNNSSISLRTSLRNSMAVLPLNRKPYLDSAQFPITTNSKASTSKRDMKTSRHQSRNISQTHLNLRIDPSKQRLGLSK